MAGHLRWGRVFCDQACGLIGATDKQAARRRFEWSRTGGCLVDGRSVMPPSPSVAPASAVADRGGRFR
jgi:hypothetical protein